MLHPYRVAPFRTQLVPYKRPLWSRLVRAYRMWRVSLQGRFRERTARCPDCGRVILHRASWPLWKLRPANGWEPLFTPVPWFEHTCRNEFAL